jgi:uncharacterized repeat protein (TIGR01451 family)
VKLIGVTAVLILALICTAFGSNAAPEKGKVEVNVVAEKEVKAIGPDGKTVIQQVPAEKVIPGDEVIYTITYTNNGDEPAENLVVNNPIPEHMQYVPGSASVSGSRITFSVDNGKSFDIPEKLTVQDVEGNPVVAKPADYTNIRWTIDQPVAPQSSGSVSYRAKLE